MYGTVQQPVRLPLSFNICICICICIYERERTREREREERGKNSGDSISICVYRRHCRLDVPLEASRHGPSYLNSTCAWTNPCMYVCIHLCMCEGLLPFVAAAAAAAAAALAWHRKRSNSRFSSSLCARADSLGNTGCKLNTARSTFFPLFGVPSLRRLACLHFAPEWQGGEREREQGRQQ